MEYTNDDTVAATSIWYDEAANSVWFGDTVPVHSTPADEVSAIIHVRVKELLRIIQVDDMEGLCDAIGSRTCVVQWKDEAGANQARVIFPELVVGMLGSRSPTAVATMLHVLSQCLHGLSGEVGSNLLDAAHEGFFLSNSRSSIVFELVRLLSQLKFELSRGGGVDDDDETIRHLDYALERIAFNSDHLMEELTWRHSAEDLVRALDRQRSLDKSLQNHIVEDMMRVIGNDAWSKMSVSIARTAIHWHYLCRDLRLKMCTSVSASYAPIYALPYAFTFIVNTDLLKGVLPSVDNVQQAPYHLRLSGKSNNGDGGSVSYDLLDWWCIISWPYLKRVMSSGYSEVMTRHVAFPDRFNRLKEVATQLVHVKIAHGVQAGAELILAARGDDALVDLVQEFDLSPFMLHSTTPTNEPVILSHMLQTQLNEYLGKQAALKALDIGVVIGAGERMYCVVYLDCAMRIISDIESALEKAINDNAHTTTTTTPFLPSSRIAYLRRCVDQCQEVFAMTRMNGHAVVLHAAASAFIQMLMKSQFV